MVFTEEFTVASSGASKTHPVQCSSLRKNGFVMIKGFPCKIAEMRVFRTGKHGGDKVHLMGTDIFTGRKYEELSPSTHNMEVPEVTRKEFVVVDLADGFFSLMGETGSIKSDLKVPADMMGDLDEEFVTGKEIVVTVLAAVGQEQVISFKANARD